MSGEPLPRIETWLKVLAFGVLFWLSGALYDAWAVFLLVLKNIEGAGAAVAFPFGIEFQLPPSSHTLPLVIKSLVAGIIAQYSIPKLLLLVDKKMEFLLSANEARKRELVWCH